MLLTLKSISQFDIFLIIILFNSLLYSYCYLFVINIVIKKYNAKIKTNIYIIDIGIHSLDIKSIFSSTIISSNKKNINIKYINTNHVTILLNFIF